MAAKARAAATEKRPDRQTLAFRVAQIVDATPEIRVLRLAPAEDTRFTFAAGQYARVAFAGQPERDYSIASRPAERLLEFHIRDMGGEGPSNFVANRLRVGDPARLRGPFGETVLRPDKPGPILAVAGGSGLAPMKAIVEEALLTHGLAQPIHLYYGGRRERDVYLEEHFAGLAARHPNLRFVPVLSEPEGPTTRRTGLVTDAIAADFDSLAGAVAYLAGPPPMVEAGRALCRDRGMAAADIHADAFIGEAERARRDGER